MNKRKFLLICPLVVLIFAVMIGCDKKVGKLPLPEPPPAVNVCDSVTYVTHIKPIIDAKCINCHGNPPSGGAPFPLLTYLDVKAIAQDGTLKKTTIDNLAPSMPYAASALPKEMKDKITCWLNNGMKEKP